MKDHRNALLFSIGWWLVRRNMRRRAEVALGTAATPSRVRWLARLVLLAGLAGGAYAAWRWYEARDDEGDGGSPLPEPEPVAPTPVAA